AYAALERGKSLLVVDGVEGKVYDGIMEGMPLFSPDSKHVAYMAQRGDKWLIVVDGVEGKEYDGFLRAAVLFERPRLLLFETPTRLRAVADRGGKELFRVQVEIVED